MNKIGTFFQWMLLINLGDVEQVKSLIKDGANVNAKDQFYGWSPLDYAAQMGKLLF